MTAEQWQQDVVQRLTRIEERQEALVERFDGHLKWAERRSDLLDEHDKRLERAQGALRVLSLLLLTLLAGLGALWKIAWHR